MYVKVTVMAIKRLLALSETPPVLDVESDSDVKSDDELGLNNKRLRLVNYPKGSVAVGVNTNPSNVETRKFHIPSFFEGAHGTAAHWNEDPMTMIWGRKTRGFFPPVPGAVVDPHRLMAFFRKRPGPDGEPVSELIGYPEAAGGSWFRCSWLAYNENIYLEPSNWTQDTDWQRAWHGSKFEALYSIMYHGEIFASHDERQGHRFKGGRPGIYVHNTDTAVKAENYIRFTPLCEDGVMWAAKWEVQVDRSQRVTNKKCDQWVQAPGSVRLVALWLCGVRYEDMQDQFEVSRAWNPKLEAHPNPPSTWHSY